MQVSPLVVTSPQSANTSPTAVPNGIHSTTSSNINIPNPHSALPPIGPIRSVSASPPLHQQHRLQHGHGTSPTPPHHAHYQAMLLHHHLLQQQKQHHAVFASSTHPTSPPYTTGSGSPSSPEHVISPMTTSPTSTTHLPAGLAPLDVLSPEPPQLHQPPQHHPYTATPRLLAPTALNDATKEQRQTLMNVRAQSDALREAYHGHQQHSVQPPQQQQPVRQSPPPAAAWTSSSPTIPHRKSDQQRKADHIMMPPRVSPTVRGVPVNFNPALMMSESSFAHLPIRGAPQHMLGGTSVSARTHSRSNSTSAGSGTPHSLRQHSFHSYPKKARWSVRLNREAAPSGQPAPATTPTVNGIAVNGVSPTQLTSPTPLTPPFIPSPFAMPSAYPLDAATSPYSCNSGGTTPINMNRPRFAMSLCIPDSTQLDRNESYVVRENSVVMGEYRINQNGLYTDQEMNMMSPTSTEGGESIHSGQGEGEGEEYEHDEQYGEQYGEQYDDRGEIVYEEQEYPHEHEHHLQHEHEEHHEVHEHDDTEHNQDESHQHHLSADSFHHDQHSGHAQDESSEANETVNEMLQDLSIDHTQHSSSEENESSSATSAPLSSRAGRHSRRTSSLADYDTAGVTLQMVEQLDKQDDQQQQQAQQDGVVPDSSSTLDTSATSLLPTQTRSTTNTNKSRSRRSSISSRLQKHSSRQSGTYSLIQGMSLRGEDLIELEIIGKGQNGNVRKAIHLPTLTRVAIKSMNIYDKSTRHQLLHELHAYSGLSSSYLIRLLGAYHQSGTIYLASEYMSSGSLLQCMKREEKKCITDERVLKHLSFQILSGLKYLHSKSRLHRDIKPDNILLNSKGECKIGDFGLMTKVSTSNPVTSEFLGTLAYLSPERLSSSEYSYSSDIWSFGISLIYMSTGYLPIVGASFWEFLASMETQPVSLQQTIQDVKDGKLKRRRSDEGEVEVDAEMVCDLHEQQSHHNTTDDSIPILPPITSTTPSYSHLAFSPEFHDFIACMLHMKPEERWTAVQLLQHPFLKDVADVQKYFSLSINVNMCGQSDVPASVPSDSSCNPPSTDRIWQHAVLSERNMKDFEFILETLVKQQVEQEKVRRKIMCVNNEQQLDSEQQITVVVESATERHEFQEKQSDDVKSLPMSSPSTGLVVGGDAVAQKEAELHKKIPSSSPIVHSEIPAADPQVPIQLPADLILSSPDPIHRGGTRGSVDSMFSPDSACSYTSTSSSDMDSGRDHSSMTFSSPSSSSILSFTASPSLMSSASPSIGNELFSPVESLYSASSASSSSSSSHDLFSPPPAMLSFGNRQIMLDTSAVSTNSFGAQERNGSTTPQYCQTPLMNKYRQVPPQLILTSPEPVSATSTQYTGSSSIVSDVSSTTTSDLMTFILPDAPAMLNSTRTKTSATPSPPPQQMGDPSASNNAGTTNNSSTSGSTGVSSLSSPLDLQLLSKFTMLSSQYLLSIETIQTKYYDLYDKVMEVERQKEQQEREEERERQLQEQQRQQQQQEKEQELQLQQQSQQAQVDLTISDVDRAYLLQIAQKEASLSSQRHHASSDSSNDLHVLRASSDEQQLNHDYLSHQYGGRDDDDETAVDDDAERTDHVNERAFMLKSVSPSIDGFAELSPFEPQYSYHHGHHAHVAGHSTLPFPGGQNFNNYQTI